MAIPFLDEWIGGKGIVQQLQCSFGDGCSVEKITCSFRVGMLHDGHGCVAQFYFILNDLVVGGRKCNKVSGNGVPVFPAGCPESAPDLIRL